MNKLNLKNGLIAISLASFLALPAVATAGSNAGSDRVSVNVSFADLDMSKAEGLATLYRRLQNATEKVCGPTNYSEAGNLAQLMRNKHCYAEALSEAVEKVDNEALDELHNS